MTKSTINRKSNMFLSFCKLVLLPVAVMCLLGYLLSLLNGQTVENTAVQATVTKMIGVGGLALLYWFVTGVKRFYRQLRTADQGIKTTVAATAAPIAVAAPPAAIVQSKRERKRIALPWLKWVRNAVVTMLILAFAGVTAMALTNPSYEEFKAFTAEHSGTLHRVEWRKVHNYLLWSVYQKDVFERKYDDDKFKLVFSQQYRGMLLNFTPLP